jgi:hypothetical protein
MRSFFWLFYILFHCSDAITLSNTEAEEDYGFVNPPPLQSDTSDYSENPVWEEGSQGKDPVEVERELWIIHKLLGRWRFYEMG